MDVNDQLVTLAALINCNEFKEENSNLTLKYDGIPFLLYLMLFIEKML